MNRYLALPLLLLACLQLVVAQFDFFGNMFGQQHHQQQQQHRSGASQWAAYSDSVSCSSYLCPETLDCVDKPVDCPCPSPEDIKCLIPDSEGDVDDATVICTRGQKECGEVEMLMKKGSSGKKSKTKSKSKSKSKSKK